VLRRIAVAAALLALATYAWLGAHARWVADDLCTAAALAQRGFLGSQAFWRATWSGRYSFYFTIGILQSLGERVVPWLPLLAISSWCAAATQWGHRRPRLFGSLGILLVYAAIDGAPDAWQSLIWQTGMLSYTAPLILATLWMGLFSRSVPPGHTGPSLSLGVTHGVLPLVACGFSETFAVCAVVGLAIGYAFTRGKALAVALLSSGVALAIVASAPGNAIRRAQFDPLPVLQVVSKTYVASSLFVVQELSFPLALVFVAAALWAPRASRRAALIAGLIAAGAVAAAHFASFAAIGVPPPPRALIVPHAFVVAAVAVFGAAVRLPAKVASVALVLLLIAGPGWSVVRNLRSNPEETHGLAPVPCRNLSRIFSCTPPKAPEDMTTTTSPLVASCATLPAS
jgi:hypothetical protein